MSDPFLFEEGEPMTAANDDAPPGRPRWRRMLKWIALVVFGVFASVHVYALIVKWAPPPATILMASQAASGQPIRKHWVPLEEISPHLVIAVIAAEDQRFL